jgi:hypothetical protein
MLPDGMDEKYDDRDRHGGPAGKQRCFDYGHLVPAANSSRSFQSSTPTPVRGVFDRRTGEPGEVAASTAVEESAQAPENRTGKRIDVAALAAGTSRVRDMRCPPISAWERGPNAGAAGAARERKLSQMILTCTFLIVCVSYLEP